MAIQEHSTLRGYYYSLSAMIIWGMFPVYWSLLSGVNIFEVLSHRTLWCVLFTGVVLVWRKRLNIDVLLKRTLQEWLVLTASAVMIATNWGLFIWAVHNELVIEASLGYFLSPLLSVMLGRFIFGEILKPLHWVAIGLATLGVVVQIESAGVAPWLGLMIGASFSVYGALRKFATADSLSGLLIETLILTPIALAYVVWFQYSQGSSGFVNGGFMTTSLLILGGVITAIPLMLFVASTKLLALSVVGFLFYVNPTIQFLVGKFYFNEAFGVGALVGFGFIWMGLIVYTIDSYRRG